MIGATSRTDRIDFLLGLISARCPRSLCVRGNEQDHNAGSTSGLSTMPLAFSRYANRRRCVASLWAVPGPMFTFRLSVSLRNGRSRQPRRKVEPNRKQVSKCLSKLDLHRSLGRNEHQRGAGFRNDSTGRPAGRSCSQAWNMATPPRDLGQERVMRQRPRRSGTGGLRPAGTSTLRGIASEPRDLFSISGQDCFVCSISRRRSCAGTTWSITVCFIVLPPQRATIRSSKPSAIANTVLADEPSSSTSIEEARIV